MSSPPTKRQRLPRACKAKRKETDIAQACELLENINFFLIKYREDTTINALLTNVSEFLNKYQPTIKPQSDEQKVGEYVDIELSDEDTWSDELSEHSSDREFIAASDEEETDHGDEDEESSYQPSECSDTSQTSQDESSNKSKH